MITVKLTGFGQDKCRMMEPWECPLSSLAHPCWSKQILETTAFLWFSLNVNVSNFGGQVFLAVPVTKEVRFIVSLMLLRTLFFCQQLHDNTDKHWRI